MQQPKPYYIDQINSLSPVQRNFEVIKGGAGVSMDHSMYELAPFTSRVIAFVLDGFFSNLIAQACQMGFAAVLIKSIGAVAATGVGFLLSLIAMVIYYVVPLKRTGQPIGKKLMKIKVVYADKDQDLTYGTCVGREFFGKVLSMIIVIGYLMPLFRVDKKTLHDIICKTKVVKA